MARARELGSLRHLVRRFVWALWPGGPSAVDEAWALSCLRTGEQALWRRMSGPDRRHALGVAQDALTLLDQRAPTCQHDEQAHAARRSGERISGRAGGVGGSRSGSKELAIERAAGSVGSRAGSRELAIERRDPVAVGGAMVEDWVGDGDGDGPSARVVVASALLHDVGKVESGLGTIARALVTACALVFGRERVAGTEGVTAHEPGWRGRVHRYFHHDRIGGALLRQAGSDPFTVAWAEQHHLPPNRWTVDQRVGAALKAADGD